MLCNIVNAFQADDVITHHEINKKGRTATYHYISSAATKGYNDAIPGAALGTHVGLQPDLHLGGPRPT